MVRKLLRCDLALALGVSGSMVSRYARRGMPVHSVELATAWCDSNLVPSLRKSARAPSLRRAPDKAGESERMFTLDEIAELLEAAGEAVVAHLVDSCGLSIEAAGVAISSIGCGLDDILEVRGVTWSPLYLVAGPDSSDPATRERILARVEQLRADFDGLQTSAS